MRQDLLGILPNFCKNLSIKFFLSYNFSTGVPVAGIEVAKNGRYCCLKRTGDNHFTGDGLGKIAMPLKVRLTAVTGEQKETVIPFMLTSDIPSGVQFSGFKAGRKFIHILIRSIVDARIEVYSFILLVCSFAFIPWFALSFISQSLFRSFLHSFVSLLTQSVIHSIDSLTDPYLTF